MANESLKVVMWIMIVFSVPFIARVASTLWYIACSIVNPPKYAVIEVEYNGIVFDKTVSLNDDEELIDALLHSTASKVD